MTGDGRAAVFHRDTRDRPAVADPRMRRDRLAAGIAAMGDRVTTKLSRLYDGPLLSSLTAVAFMALSIIFNISLS